MTEQTQFEIATYKTDLDDMKLILYPNPILDEMMPLVDLTNPGFDPVELKDRMTKMMLENRGQGMAANQCNLRVSAFVMASVNDASRLFINPTIVNASDETELSPEGCLSSPGIWMRVARPKVISVHWYDENLEEQLSNIQSIGARIFLHEYDHLMGITYKDRVSKLKWDRAVQKKAKVYKRFIK
jgi:peptide deformylase